MDKKVIMEAKFKAHPASGRPLSWYAENRGHIDIGGFEVKVDGYEFAIPFDFEATCLTHNPDGTYSYGNWDGFLFKEFDVDPCHEEDWALNGHKKEDITASLLASASEITDFYFSVSDVWDNEVECSLELVSIEFSNEEQKVFSISQNVIDKFNNILKENVV